MIICNKLDNDNNDNNVNVVNMVNNMYNNVQYTTVK